MQTCKHANMPCARVRTDRTNICLKVSRATLIMFNGIASLHASINNVATGFNTLNTAQRRAEARLDAVELRVGQSSSTPISTPLPDPSSSGASLMILRQVEALLASAEKAAEASAASASSAAASAASATSSAAASAASATSSTSLASAASATSSTSLASAASATAEAEAEAEVATLIMPEPLPDTDAASRSFPPPSTPPIQSEEVSSILQRLLINTPPHVAKRRASLTAPSACTPRQSMTKAKMKVTNKASATISVSDE